MAKDTGGKGWLGLKLAARMSGRCLVSRVSQNDRELELQATLTHPGRARDCQREEAAREREAGRARDCRGERGW